MSRRIAFGIALATATICAAVAVPSSRTVPPLRPPDSSFTSRVDNPWFPLLPGSRYVYRGVKDGQPSRDVVAVAHRTATIDGVPCAVVEDRLYVHGRLAERTTDFYTQDRRATSGTSGRTPPSSAYGAR